MQERKEPAHVSVVEERHQKQVGRSQAPVGTDPILGMDGPQATAHFRREVGPFAVESIARQAGHLIR